MKKKEIVKIIRYLDTGIFPATILFSVGFKYDELMPLIKKGGWAEGIKADKNLIDSGEYFALGRYLESIKTGKQCQYYYIIITEQFRFTDYNMCRVAHEVLHICQFFMKDILDMEREFESVAYTHTHIMTQCLKELREANK